MKNNNQENKSDKQMEQISEKMNSSYNNKEYYYTANNFYNKNEIDKKYNYYLSAFNKEKGNTNEIFIPKKNEQIEKLLEEEKNIEDENVQRLKELRTKYLSSVKTSEEEKDLYNYFTKNSSYDNEENKLWKLSYSKNDMISNNSRNSLDNNIYKTPNRLNSTSTNHDINIRMNKLIYSNNKNITDINMSIYDRKNNQNENQSFNAFNTYIINNSDLINKSEEAIRIPKYENIIQNQEKNDLISLNDYKNLENNYNKLKYDFDILKEEYMNLLNKYNVEKSNKEEYNNKKEVFNDYIIKEKEQLKNINANYEYVLTPLINYINDVDYIIDKNNLKKIDIIKLKKNIKSLFPNKSITNAKEHPLYPFLKLLQNYKNIINNNENLKKLPQNDKSNKNSQKKGITYESILLNYNLKENIKNIKFKSLDHSKNKISRSIVATPINCKNEKLKKFFAKRNNVKFFKSEKNSIRNKNKTKSIIKNERSKNENLTKESN